MNSPLASDGSNSCFRIHFMLLPKIFGYCMLLSVLKALGRLNPVEVLALDQQHESGGYLSAVPPTL